MAIAITPSVAPSGQSIVFLFQDDSTDPATNAPVTSIVDNNEVQSLTLTGKPSGGTFTLTFGGQTTAPIPAIPSPPAFYLQWNATVSPGTYDLSVDAVFNGGLSPRVLYEIFDGAPGETPLGTFVFNQSGPSNSQPGDPVDPTPFNDSKQQRNDGVTPGVSINWYPLGRFTLPTGDLHVRVSCPIDFVFGRNTIVWDDLRIATTDGATVVYVQPAVPPATQVAGPSFTNSPETWQVFGNTANAVEMEGRGAGVRYLVDPAVLQSALQALSSIGSGNVNVVETTNSLAAKVYQIKFVGALAGESQPLVTKTDGAVSIARVAAGGILPILTRNGAQLPYGIDEVFLYQVPYTYGDTTVRDPQMPNVWIQFRQSPAAVFYISASYYDSRLVGNGWGTGVFGGGYTATGPSAIGQTAGSSDPAATAVYRYFPMGRAATIRVAITWPPNMVLSNSVTYTIKTWNAGTTLGTFTVDQTVAPSGATDSTGAQPVPFQILGSYAIAQDDGLIVTQSNGTSNLMFADTIRFERTSSDNSIVIAPDDVVTATWGDNWATVPAGMVTATTGPVTVTNLVGGQMYPALLTSTTMKVGWNIQSPQNQVGSPYTNLFRMSDLGDDASITGIRANPSYEGTLSTTWPAFDADFKTWANVEPGNYILMYDGPQAGAVEIVATSGTATENASPVYTGAANNKRFYTLTGDSTHYGPVLNYKLIGVASGGSFNYTATNLRLYHDDVNLSSPPKFDATRHTARLTPVQSARFLDCSQCDLGNGVNFADYSRPDGVYSRWAPQSAVNVPIASIQGYTWNIADFPRDFFIDPTTGMPDSCIPMLITTVGNHGFAKWTTVTLNVPSAGNATFTSGPAGSLDGFQGFVWPLSDPTKFVFPYFSFDRKRMTNTLAAPGNVNLVVGGIMPIADVVDMCNAGGIDLWWQPGYCNTVDCVTQVAEYVAAHLNPGLKFQVEISNETWNFFANNSPAVLAAAASWVFYGYAAGRDGVAFHCETSNTFWTAMRAAWLATNGPDSNPRQASDFVRVMGSLGGNSGYSRELANYCVLKGFTFDAVAVAPYFDNMPITLVQPDPRFTPLLARSTVGQNLDMLESHFIWGGYETAFSVHYDAVIASGYASPFNMVSYEGGPEKMHMEGGVGANNLRKNHGVVRHPRFWGIYQHILRLFQGAGGPGDCTVFHDYLLSNIDITDQGGDGNDGKVWSAYFGPGTQPYVPGNPTQDAIQINQFDRLDLVQSVTGGGLQHFGSLFDSTPVPGFTIAITGATTVAQGASITLTVTMTPFNGYVGTAALAIASGLTAGLTQVGPFSPTSLTGGGTMVGTFVLAASGSATTGSTTIVVTATDTPNELISGTTSPLMVTPTGSPPSPTVVAIAAQHVHQFRHVH